MRRSGPIDITLVETKGTIKFELAELKKRTEESARSEITRHYKALSQSDEVAFVSLDRWPEPPQLVVYEIFVSKFARRQGVASAVLNEIERIAACENISIVRLRPWPLDDDITKDALIDWYSSKGYERDSSVPWNYLKKYVAAIGKHTTNLEKQYIFWPQAQKMSEQDCFKFGESLCLVLMLSSYQKIFERILIG